MRIGVDLELKDGDDRKEYIVEEIKDLINDLNNFSHRPPGWTAPIINYRIESDDGQTF